MSLGESERESIPDRALSENKSLAYINNPFSLK